MGDLSLRRLVTSILFIYGSLCVMGLVLPRWLLYMPHAPGYDDAAAGTIKLTTRNGAHIATRYDPVKGAPFTVLFSHGNAEDLGDARWFIDRMHGLGLSVLAYDYEGYGTSDGTPSERALYDDIDAVYDHLTQILGVAADRVILYGRSLGGGPTVDLASRKPVAGVILESAFMSAFRVPFRVRVLPWDQFENLAKIARVACPVLVMHGSNDPLIPLAHGRALFDAAPSPDRRFLMVPGGGHGDVPFVAGERYEAAIRELVATLSRH